MDPLEARGMHTPSFIGNSKQGYFCFRGYGARKSKNVFLFSSARKPLLPSHYRVSEAMVLSDVFEVMSCHF